MAKRFTDTEKWRKPWYRKLSTQNKVLWQYFLDNCDHAGLIRLDAEIIKLDTNISTTVERIEEDFKGKVFSINCGYYWIPRFITFQYSEKFLNGNDKCGISVRARLSAFGISVSCENGKLIPNLVGASKGLARGYDPAIVTDTDTDTVKVKDTVKGKGEITSDMLHCALNMYRKKSKAEEGLKLLRKSVETKKDYDDLLQALRVFEYEYKDTETKYLPNFKDFCFTWKSYAVKKTPDQKLLELFEGTNESETT